MTQSQQSDLIVDRRRLRTRLSRWRLLTFGTIILAIVIIGLSATRSIGALSPHIARVHITGLITGSEATLKLLAAIAEDQTVLGTIIEIDSPGGTTNGSEKIYQGIRAIAQKKPVVAVINNLGASGAYISALGADRILASGNSLVGSIGVIVQYPNFSKLMETIGIQQESIRSTPLKATPNGFEPTSEASRAAMAAIVADSYEWFKALVKERRNLNEEELARVDDGRVFTGRQCLSLKLIDDIGEDKDARLWMETEKSLPKNLAIIDHFPLSPNDRLSLLSMSADAAEMMNMMKIAELLRKFDGQDQQSTLDGVLAIWQFAR